MSIFKEPFDTRFPPHWLSYVGQSLLCTGSVFVVLVALRQQNLVVAASLAATAFTVFAMPKKVTASPRNVIGGHLVGLVFGCGFALIPTGSVVGQDVMYALAVGGAMFVMAITNTEHPPAAGTALGVVMTGFSAPVVMGVVVGVGALSLIHAFLKPVLRDLILVPEEQVGADGR